MSHYLVVVPKKREIPTFKLGSAEIAHLGTWIEAGSVFSDPAARTVGPDNEIYCLTWDRQEDSSGFGQHGERWFVTSGMSVAGELLENVEIVRGEYQYRNPVWGSYTAVGGDFRWGSIEAWQTVPATFSVCFAETENYIITSDVPIFCAFIKSYIETGWLLNIELDKEFIAEYIGVGYSLSRKTPFSGVSMLCARERLSIRSGQVSISRTPSGLDHELPVDHSLQDSSEALTQALRDSFRRIADGAKHPLRLLVSGGKDSRLVMGLAKEAQKSADATCFGFGRDADSRIAAVLSERAGFDFLCTNRPFYVSSDLERSVQLSLKDTLGLPHSVAHHTPYAFPEVNHLNETVILGNWPPYHAVYHRLMRYSNADVHSVVDRTITEDLVEAKRSEVTEILHDWVDKTPAMTNVHKLYEFGVVFRGGRWMQPVSTAWTKKSKCGFFMSDQELGSLADKLTMFEQISFGPEFIALRNIWSEASRMPLANDTWRFEANGPSENPLLDPAGYSERMKDIGDDLSRFPKARFQQTGTSLDDPVSDDVISQIRRNLQRSDYQDIVQTYMSADLIDTFVNDLESLTLEQRQIIWRAYVICVLFDKKWLY